ncbi:acetylajmalan esterase-like [Lycium barbarum]|uniref:acetylajmalan esterase-like n=1 Tax=Lycium barbarum TaxID=112863 RepID=UPI00293EAC02|nr:acetylajmalan esterase-like [Lycium barbarum]
MASLPKVSFFLLLITIAFHFSPCAAQTKCGITSVYHFGDSLADAGNTMRLPGVSLLFPTSKLPYGRTFFKRPTGRASDGRIINDFIVSSLNLPCLNAYLNNGTSFKQGVNFAVSGATALNNAFWATRKVNLRPWNKHLAAQLGWFKSHLQSTCGANCKQTLKNSLVILGEFGGVDYFNCFFQNKQAPKICTYVPLVIAEIMRGIREVIQLGATRILVPGVYPFGCLPVYLTRFVVPNPNAYNPLCCLRNMNGFAAYHNTELNKALQNLQRQLPNVRIVYGDYFGALTTLLRNAPRFGFNQNTLLSACCGGGGRYNTGKPRGSAGATVCPNLSGYVNWDGIHLTDEAHHRMADIIVRDMLPKFGCNNVEDSGVLMSSY